MNKDTLLLTNVLPSTSWRCTAMA